MLREADRRAYLACLLAPADRRDDLAALALYGVELARVPLAVNEPGAGEIRLQWWAEVAGGERDGEGRGHPVGAALLDAIAAHDLPREPLAAVAEARSFDLYHDPMPDRAAFEAYAGATASVPIQMAARALDPDAASGSAEAAGHAGVYAALIDRLATLARDRAGGRVFLPTDVLLEAWVQPDELTGEAFARGDGADGADGAAGEAGADGGGGREGGDGKARALLDALLAYADHHHTRFHAAACDLPPSLAPAFAAAEARGVTERAIRRMGPAVLHSPPPPAPLAEQRAVMGAQRMFAGGAGGGGTSLLGRLRERLGL